jgi:hypothetical protein
MNKIEFTELIKDIGFKRQTFGWTKKIDYKSTFNNIFYDYINLSEFESSVVITISKISKFNIEHIDFFRFNLNELTHLDFLKLISELIDVSNLEKKYIRDNKINSICYK